MPTNECTLCRHFFFLPHNGSPIWLTAIYIFSAVMAFSRSISTVFSVEVVRWSVQFDPCGWNYCV